MSRVSTSNLSRTTSTHSQDPYRADPLDPIPPTLYDDTPNRSHLTTPSFRVDRHGRPVHFPWRTTLATLTLFSIGLVFILVGALHIWEKDQTGGIVMVSLGGLAFLPGTWAAFVLWKTVTGTPGYRMEDIAVHDDFRW